MKKISILCAALAMAALSFTSCQKEESYTANQQFIATFEQTGNDKVYVNDDLQMYWADIEHNSMLGVFAPGFSIVDNNGYINYCIPYYPTHISPDGKTAVLEHAPNAPSFPTGQQGPFYAVSDAVMWASCHINDDGSFHIGGTHPVTDFMPMVARADNFGQLQFKHLFGMMKVYINLPEGYTLFDAGVIAHDGDYDLGNIECDVTWDANGEITMSNINRNEISNDLVYAFMGGNGFGYLAVAPGDWSNLTFSVYAYDQNDHGYRFHKDMRPGTSIHIERAGVTTLTLNFTENDIVQ